MLALSVNLGKNTPFSTRGGMLVIFFLLARRLKAVWKALGPDVGSQSF